MDRMYKSELDLLRWLDKRKTGALIEDVMARFKVARQVAYTRVTRLHTRDLLKRRLENGTGARKRHRYSLAKWGRQALTRTWKKTSKRIVVAA